MASSMPEIGSKISLISKADIRYEGKLFTVDPNECTIALSHVRSYGTEDRQTQYPVPAQSQVYEYILFRGSDIKDISIVNAQQLPNDPAIVSQTVSGHAPSMPSAYPSHSYNHPVMPTPMAPPQYGGYMAPGMGRSMGKQGMSMSVLELLAGSRSSTPSLARKSPTIDQAVQVSPHKDKKAVQPPVPREGRQSNRNERSYQDVYQRRDFRGQRENDYRAMKEQRENDYRGQRDNLRDDYRGPREGQREDFRGQRDGQREDFRGQRDNQHNDYRVQRDHDHRIQDNRRESYPQGQQQQQRQNQSQGMNRGGWINRGGGRGGPGQNMRGRGRGGGVGGNFNRAPGSGGQNQQQTNPNAVKKNTLKFDEEYDFDKANSEFEELRSKTAKLKISGEPEAEKPKVNGEDKKDDSGNETGLGEGEPEEETDQALVYYDKAKSFFDNISCEAVERSKGRSQRTDWRTERKLNSETFGVASARRGSYRARGGYYGGRGMYRGYRGYNNMRGQGGNRSNLNQPRPVHSQPQPTATAAAK